MARITINLGTPPSGTDGDPVRTAFEKVNTMTKELYEKDASLGTAATRNVISSRTDNTNGRILDVGAFGWNGGNSIQLPATGDANSLTVSGNYLFANGGLNLPEGAPFPHITVIVAFPGYSTQIARSSTTAGEAIRLQSGGTFGPWFTFYTSANAVSSVAKGGLIESGSSANGTYTKWADGTMQASLVISKPNVNSSVPSGSLFYSSNQVASTNYAAAFISPPEVSVSVAALNYGGAFVGRAYKGTASASPQLALFTPGVATFDCIIEIIARGRWKN